jgi:hypothetical protein
MVGDLHEEFGKRAASGERWVRLWYMREALGIAVRYCGSHRVGVPSVAKTTAVRRVV